MSELKGKSRLQLNSQTAMAAMEFWLNERLIGPENPVIVTGITVDDGWVWVDIEPKEEPKF